MSIQTAMPPDAARVTVLANLGARSAVMLAADGIDAADVVVAFAATRRRCMGASLNPPWALDGASIAARGQSVARPPYAHLLLALEAHERQYPS
jgi:hypothetical protein